MDTGNTFPTLKSLLAQYESSLTVVHDKSDNYYLNTPSIATNQKSEFFGAVQGKKSYVALHLMPIYYYPELLGNISTELRNKMQGKSCFHFKDSDENLFNELNELIISSFEKYRSLQKV